MAKQGFELIANPLKKKFFFPFTNMEEGIAEDGSGQTTASQSRLELTLLMLDIGLEPA